VSSVLTRYVGTLDLVDLNVLNKFYGRDFLPYPFMFTQPSRFATRQEASAYTGTVPDRFSYGDLNVFKDCLIAYIDADIRVECHVQHMPADVPSVRALAYRAELSGFFAEQRADTDLIDVYTVSPYDLGAAICEATTLTGSGEHSQIVVPEYVSRWGPRFDAGDSMLSHRVVSSAEVAIPASRVAAYAKVQSHWRPTRKWGFDRGKKALVWIRVRDDGEYMYVPDNDSHAIPMTSSTLNEQIDLLITEDIAQLREFRDD
jgi:hypothetical protein